MFYSLGGRRVAGSNSRKSGHVQKKKVNEKVRTAPNLYSSVLTSYKIQGAASR